jgi:hypothetical protein
MTVITRYLIQQLQKKVTAPGVTRPARLGRQEPKLFFGISSCQGQGGRIIRAAACCLLLLALLPLRPVAVEGAAVPVRFSEGMVRGFLVLHDAGGKRLASGDFLQVSRDGEIKSRTVLHFKDGSLHDETAVFTQQRNFVMKSYRLQQKGPSFRDEMDVSLERASGIYRVKVKPRGGQEKVLTGKLNLPTDVYNGMVPIVVKNLPKGAKETVHMVAFTPTPRVIELEVTPSVEDRVLVGDLSKSALHYILKPKLGLLKIPAMVVGQLPPDNHLWIMTSDVPAFVRFQGPLAPGGPIWVIELASPVWGK